MDDVGSLVKSYFSKLGFEAAVADIYNALYLRGPQTISDLARSSKVERTLIYRLLPLLTENNLIEVESEYKHGIVKASPISNLQILLSKREQELQTLQDGLPQLERSLLLATKASPETRVQFYRGLDGVKQMLWNETKATTDVLGVLHEIIQVQTSNKFFERWVAKCNQAGINFRGIVGDTFLASQKHWHDEHSNERIARWESHYVSPQVFTISHSTVVYDGVVAHFNWTDDEVFGVELYNQQIADTQRQLFELLWRS